MARISAKFDPAKSPGTGEKAQDKTAGYLESFKQLADAKKNGQLALVYIFDSKNAKQRSFDTTMTANEELGIALKLFRRVGVDVAKDAIAREQFGNNVPMFVAYNAKGVRIGDTELRGYKPKFSGLMRLLGKAAKGHGKMSLKSFVKNYRSILNKIDQIENKKGNVAAAIARANGNAKKIKDLSKKSDELQKDEAKILENEKKVLTAAKAADLPPTKKDVANAPAGGG
jgi:hypothetical protein